MRLMASLLTLVIAVTSAAAAEPQPSPHAKLAELNLGEARWSGGLMGERFTTCRDVSIPAMERLMEGTEPTQFFENFRIAAGLAEGKHRGPKFNDGDFYKWLEAASATYAFSHDADLDRRLDAIIDVIAKAQRADGYLHTPVIINERQGGSAKPFTNPLDFELYNMGHLMSAACVHHEATGKANLLQVARKAADFLCVAFDKPTPDLARFGICPSHYMGLVDLYRTTGEGKYLDLARKLIDMRDLVQNGTDDNQDRIPFRKQTAAIGHAVRANYLYAGAADVYMETGDATLLDPLQKIWQDVVDRKLYITGGCGALYDGASPDGSSAQKTITRVHQAYGRDYQLPNTTAHNETCAAIGGLLWNWRMLQITGDARYADVLETMLYNSILSGIGQDGTTFFYTNPLRVMDPMPVALRWSRVRQPFISTFCCPPNVLRTIAESARYAYARSDQGLWVTLYGAGTLTTKLVDGTPVELTQRTDYPWDGKIRIELNVEQPKEFSLMLRIPGWAKSASIRVDGKPFTEPATPGTFIEIRRPWAHGDVVELDFPMSPRVLEANPYVEETLNQLAVMRGPLVYCAESPDLPTGVRPLDIRVPRDIQLSATWDPQLIGGTIVLSGRAKAAPRGDWSGQLYRDAAPQKLRDIDLRLIPYFRWANRGKSEMSVWLPAGE
jgi:uncharacterized protein